VTTVKILLCIDDTDNADSPGTGHLAARLASLIEARRYGNVGFVTRHQLLVHPEIPYTSHNSSMCLDADVDEGALGAVIDTSAEFLARESAPGSDPGLCILRSERLAQRDALVDFGMTAKTCIVSKTDAIDLARRLDIHLSEHGGTGLGVIGALAGAGLRLGGNDGRLRGRLPIAAGVGSLSVADLLALRAVEEVRDPDGRALAPHERVALSEKVKTVMRGGHAVLLVLPNACGTPRWRTCTIAELRAY
jgi:hypothetical protein